jgi:predicted transcriptional regulator
MYHYENKYTKKIIEESRETKWGHDPNISFKGILNRITKEIADELGITRGEVQNVIKSVFKFISVVLGKVKSNYYGEIDSGNMPEIKLKYIGKFSVSDYRVKKMMYYRRLKLKNKKDADNRQK